MPKVAFVNPDISFDVQHGTPESGDSDTCEGQGSRSLALESLAANPNAELRVATVFVGGFPIAIQGDYNTEHVHGNLTPCDKHSKPLETGSTLVFVSGKGCGRAGDTITDCTFVETGYETVFVGPPIEEE